MSFSEQTKGQALLNSMRSCCICHRFVGLKIELHHIVHKSEGGSDAPDNCIPLCFDCHGDMRSYDSKHPKGTKYTRAELIAHRDRWYARVLNSPANSYSPESKKLDIELFEEIRSMLPWDGSIQLARQHIFSAPFASILLDQFSTYVERLYDPAFEFLDADLESLRASMSTSIVVFTESVLNKCSHLDENIDYIAIPKILKQIQREKFYDEVKALRLAGDQVSLAYDEFIRAGRRKLQV